MGRLTTLILSCFPHLSQEAHIFFPVYVVRKEISNIEVLLNSSVERKNREISSGRPSPCFRKMTCNFKEENRTSEVKKAYWNFQEATLIQNVLCLQLLGCESSSTMWQRAWITLLLITNTDAQISGWNEGHGHLQTSRENLWPHAAWK